MQDSDKNKKQLVKDIAYIVLIWLTVIFILSMLYIKLTTFFIK
jgi:hypothetical protein